MLVFTLNQLDIGGESNQVLANVGLQQFLLYLPFLIFQKKSVQDFSIILLTQYSRFKQLKCFVFLYLSFSYFLFFFSILHPEVFTYFGIKPIQLRLKIKS